ncbi:MAG: glycosyltransferase family 2 protein [Hydrogenophaga sp.]|nr:glycosyltransferase family 2 protein [Hydrogenophaga sp.]
MNKADKPRVGIALIVKNEGPYLIEWLAHHHLVGFDHFYVVNNDSSDNTWPLLQALSQTLPITCFSYATPPGAEPQLLVYEEIVRRHGHEVEWMAFLDADEFLWPSQYPDTVSDLLQATLQAHPDAGAMALNWATYGSSMKIAKESGLVTERFLHHAPQQHHVNHHFKSIIRMDAFAGFVCPHSCQLKPGYRYLHTDGAEKRDYLNAGQRNPSQSGDVCWTGFRVNHYVIKAYAEYVHRKAPRGRAFFGADQLNDQFFLNHDNNDLSSHPCPQHIADLKALCHDVTERIGLADPSILLANPAAPPEADNADLHLPVVGSVESLEEQAEFIRITGWVLLWKIQPAAGFIVTFQGRAVPIETWQATERTDVQHHYPSAGLQNGFNILIRKPVQATAQDIAVSALTPDGHTTQAIPPGTFANAIS